ncbi:MAG TPA: CbiQ family ECF transporter T component, partial [Nitrospirota bacterium]
MHFEDFAAGGSFLHRMDPRVKIVSLFFYAAVVAVSTGLSALAAALAFSVLLTWSADVSVVKVAQRLVVVNAFVLFLWVMLPFSIPGDPVFTVLGLAATKQGFHQTL